MMKNIPQKRALIYTLFAGLLPLFFAAVWFWGAKQQVVEVQESFDFLVAQIATKQSKQAQNRAVAQLFSNADHFYIDKRLETLTFLETELEQLQTLVDGSLPLAEPLLKRYDQLSGPQNALSFIEGQVHSYPTFQETSETLAHPVEVNVSDLQKVLALIEGIEIDPVKPYEDRPQLIITDFKIEKRQVQPEHETFLLNLKLLKREYL